MRLCLPSLPRLPNAPIRSQSALNEFKRFQAAARRSETFLDVSKHSQNIPKYFHTLPKESQRAPRNNNFPNAPNTVPNAHKTFPNGNVLPNALRRSRSAVEALPRRSKTLPKHSELFLSLILRASGAAISTKRNMLSKRCIAAARSIVTARSIHLCTLILTSTHNTNRQYQILQHEFS